MSESHSITSSANNLKLKQNSPWNPRTASKGQQGNLSQDGSLSGPSSVIEPVSEKKKDKKLVFLSRSVLQSVRESP
jgi:hypothetical protein